MTAPKRLMKPLRRAKMINKSFELSVVKETKGKIEVKFEEITKVSAYVKEESNNLLLSLLEIKLADAEERKEQPNNETPNGGANE